MNWNGEEDKNYSRNRQTGGDADGDKIFYGIIL